VFREPLLLLLILQCPLSVDNECSPLLPVDRNSDLTPGLIRHNEEFFKTLSTCIRVRAERT
jgi:hypothetical protein